MKKFNFKLGADPEFLMFHNYKLVAAHNVMPKFLKAQENTNISSVEGMGFKTPFGNIGWDGHGATGELRPKATNDPKELAQNIGNMYKELNKVLPFVDVTTLSINAPIGGHIHLEIPYKTDKEQSEFENLRNNNRKINQLKRLIATFLIPFNVSDHKISATARMSGTGYGNLSDVRFEAKNGSEDSDPFATAEVRGLTAEWQTTPELTEATLAYLGVVWHEIFYKKKMLSKENAVLKNNFQASQLQSIVLSDYKPIQTSLLNEIKKIIKTFELYPTFKKEVDLILSPARVYEIKKEAGWNIYNGWNLQQTQKGKISDKTLLSEKSLQKKLKTIDFDSIKDEFNIKYNSDTNVEIFANSIVERIAALGWQPKNDYFLFGIKGDEYAIANIKEEKYYQLPVNRDPSETVATLRRMQARYQEFYQNGSLLRIDPKNGSVKSYSSNPIIIGIPYTTRMKKDTKDFIKKIIQLEKDKLPTKKDYEDFIEKYEANNKNRKENPEDLLNSSMTALGTSLSTTEYDSNLRDRISILLDNNQD